MNKVKTYNTPPRPTHSACIKRSGNTAALTRVSLRPPQVYVVSLSEPVLSDFLVWTVGAVYIRASRDRGQLLHHHQFLDISFLLTLKPVEIDTTGKLSTVHS
jgi:hypothetical protein